MPDWRAPTNKLLDDAAGAYARCRKWRESVGKELSDALLGQKKLFASVTNALKRQVSEYLLEEGRLTPPKPELEHFYDAVQSVAMRVERAQNQVEKLLAKAAARGTSQ